MRDPASVTFEKALDELREIAEKRQAENGGVDFIYRPPNGDGICKYVHYSETETGWEPTSGCIVGTWAHQYHGVDLEWLARNNEGSAPGLMECALNFKDQEVIMLMQRVQQEQDRGIPWVEAVRIVGEELGTEEGDL